MEFIEGCTLDAQWAYLSQCQKSEISMILKQSFDELRSLPSPGFYGSIGRDQLLHGISWTPRPVPASNGPFDPETALNEALAFEIYQRI
ncbi:hypothetical protein GX48_02465 [Paracoccidioides brasiliensis]|nr:hypothetical protein GX48_02465 [Paracoccidioides brasiliensis]